MSGGTIIAAALGLREEEAFGDVPAVPMELRPARELRVEGVSEQGGRAVTDGSHSHVGTGQ